MCNLKRQAPSTALELDDEKRRKRFRHLLLNRKTDARLELDGETVFVHKEVLNASSPEFSKQWPNGHIPIPGKTVDVVNDFVFYLHGFSVLDDDYSVEKAVDLVELFNRFKIQSAATRTANFCLNRCAPEQLGKLYDVMGNDADLRNKFVKKVADSLDCVDVRSLDYSIMNRVLNSSAVSELWKALAVGRWVKANPGSSAGELIATIDFRNATQEAKKLHENNQKLEKQLKELSEETQMLKAKLAATESDEDFRVPLGASSIRRRKKVAIDMREKEDSMAENNGEEEVLNTAVPSLNLNTMNRSFPKSRTLSKGRVQQHSPKSPLRRARPKRYVTSSSDEGDFYHIPLSADNDTTNNETLQVEKKSIESSDSEGDPNPSQTLNPNVPSPDNESRFAEWVSLMQRTWQHPPGKQMVTLTFHRARAILKVRNFSQKKFADEVFISQSMASYYIRGLYLGALEPLEQRVREFVNKYVDIQYGTIPQCLHNLTNPQYIPLNLVSRSSPVKKRAVPPPRKRTFVGIVPRRATSIVSMPRKEAGIGAVARRRYRRSSAPVVTPKARDLDVGAEAQQRNGRRMSESTARTRRDIATPMCTDDGIETQNPKEKTTTQSHGVSGIENEIKAPKKTKDIPLRLPINEPESEYAEPVRRLPQLKRKSKGMRSKYKKITPVSTPMTHKTASSSQLRTQVEGGGEGNTVRNQSVPIVTRMTSNFHVMQGENEAPTERSEQNPEAIPAFRKNDVVRTPNSQSKTVESRSQKEKRPQEKSNVSETRASDVNPQAHAATSTQDENVAVKMETEAIPNSTIVKPRIISRSQILPQSRPSVTENLSDTAPAEKSPTSRSNIVEYKFSGEDFDQV